jgi:Tfp pilus assembly protein PilO
MALVSLKPSSKTVTALIIIAVVLFFGCVLAYMAAASKLKSSQAELEAGEKKVADAEQIILKLEKAKLDYLDARSQLRFLESSVTSQSYVPTLLKQIERLGESVNLKVLGVRPQPAPPSAQPTRTLSSGAKAASGDVEGASAEKSGATFGAAPQSPPPPYDELKIDLELEGKYMNLLDFLYSLTSFPKIVAVNSVEISPAAKADDYGFGPPKLTIKINVTAFIFKEGQQAPAPPAPPVTSQDLERNRRAGHEAG